MQNNDSNSLLRMTQWPWMTTVIYVGSYYNNDCRNGDGVNEEDDNDMTRIMMTE